MRGDHHVWQCLTANTDHALPAVKRNWHGRIRIRSLSGGDRLQPGLLGTPARVATKMTANPTSSCKGGSTTVTAFANFQYRSWLVTPVNGPTGLPLAQLTVLLLHRNQGHCADSAD